MYGPMNNRELFNDLPPYLFAAAAIVAFTLAIYLALHDRIKGGTLLGTIAFVAALLAYLPQLDSLSAFMVNVKLKSSLDRADEILGKLRDLSVVNAKLAYTTIAWGNRFGNPKASEKQRILDAVDEQLVALNVPADERSGIQQAYIRFIAFDFYRMYVLGIDYALSRRNEGMLQRLQTEPSDANKAAANHLNTKMNEWRGTMNTNVEEIPLNAYRKFLHDKAPIDTFMPDETAALNRFADKIADLFEASKQKGGYTDEAAKFYDRYSDDGLGAAMYRDVFNPQ